MLEITTISNHSGSAAARLHQITTGGGRQRPPAYEMASSDRVELTAAAQNRGPAPETMRILDERIGDLRARIDAGTYLTSEKLDYVIDRLHAELFGVLPDVA